MSKNLIKGLTVFLFVVAVATWNLNFGSKTDGSLSNLTFAESEVLAQVESTGGSGSGSCQLMSQIDHYSLCDGVLTEQKNGAVIDLDKARLNTEDYFLYSSIYKGVKTILLETNESCLVGVMNKMRVYDPYIIILDANIAKSVLIFDMTGRFIRKIGSVGSGPREYTHPLDFAVDKEENLIYVIDGFLNKINKYDLTTGEFIHSIILDRDVRSYNIEYVGGKLFADAYFNKHSDDNYLIRIIKEPSGKIDGRFLNVNKYGKGFSNSSLIYNNVFHLRDNGNVIFFQPLMDQIIEISNESVSILLEFRSKDLITSENIKTVMEKNPLHPMLDLVQYNKYFKIIDFIEYGNIIQINYQKGNQLRLVLFNKQTNEVSIFQKRHDDLYLK